MSATPNINGEKIQGSITGLTSISVGNLSATTYQNLPLDVFVTGGTFGGGDIIFTNNTGGTFSVSGISSFDTFVTGFTYSDNTFTISQNSGSPLNATIDVVTGFTINGDLVVTGSTSSNSISATTYQNLPQDIYVTGGTYDNNTGTATFTNTSGGTFSVSGFTTGGTSGTDVYVSGGTFDKNTETITFTNTTGGTFSVTGLTDFFVSGGTYSAGTITFDNTNGTSFNVTGITSGGSSVNFKYVKNNSISFLEANTTLAIRTFLLNEIVFYPIYVRQALDITHAQLQVTSTAGAASRTIVGVYDNGTDGLPTNLLDSVIINTTSNSLFSTAFSTPLSLTPGTYWVGVNTNISYACYCVRNATLGNLQNTFVNVVSSDTGAGLNIYERYRLSYTYDGTLPNPVASPLTLTISDYANPFITFLIDY